MCPAQLDLESAPLSIQAVSVDPGETCDLIEDVMSRRDPAWDGLLDPLSAILLGHGRGEVDPKGPDAAVDHPKAVESGFGPVRNQLLVILRRQSDNAGVASVVCLPFFR